MENKQKLGHIYKITSPSGKIYIGQTFYLAERKCNYKSLNCKKQRMIYNSLLKYGWEAHTFEILESSNFTKQEIFDREIYYIESLKTFAGENEKGMNLTKGGHGTLGGALSEEHKKKISETKKKAPRTEAENKASMLRIGSKVVKTEEWIKHNGEAIKKSIVQLTLEGVFVKEWKSAIDVQNELGFCRKNLSSCLRNKTKSACEYKWIFKQN